MLDLIVDLLEFLKLMWGFIFSLIEDLIKVVGLLSTVVLDIPVWLEAFLPPGVAGLFVVAISVTVIYRILARD